MTPKFDPTTSPLPKFQSKARLEKEVAAFTRRYAPRGSGLTMFVERLTALMVSYTVHCSYYTTSGAASTLPTHCYSCGVYLMGGATVHAPGCELGALIEGFKKGAL